MQISRQAQHLIKPRSADFVMNLENTNVVRSTALNKSPNANFVIGKTFYTNRNIDFVANPARNIPRKTNFIINKYSA